MRIDLELLPTAVSISKDVINIVGITRGFQDVRSIMTKLKDGLEIIEDIERRIWNKFPNLFRFKKFDDHQGLRGYRHFSHGEGEYREQVDVEISNTTKYKICSITC
jgi:hypothetical protein